MFKKSISMLTVFSKRLMSLQKPGGIDWTKQKKAVLKPFDYIYNLPGKHLGIIISDFNQWLQIPEDKVKDIQKILQIVTTWVILSDDIQDDSSFRYGVPSANRLYGVGLTMNSASYALLTGVKEIMELGHPLAFEVYLKRIEDYILGEGTDMYWRDNYIWPTEEEHIGMAKKKVGSFFAFPIELMHLFSRSDKSYVDLATKVGLYYELIDDYYNTFQSKNLEILPTIKQENYIPSSDITESKITLAIIHAMQFPDVATELAYILKQRTTDPALKNRALWLLKKHGSDQYMRDALKRLETDIRTEVDRFGGNAKLLATLEELSY